MKKFYFLLIILILFSVIYGQQKKLTVNEAYFTKEKYLLVSDTDIYCSYEIGKKKSNDIKIIGSREMESNKSEYSTGDYMFINKGLNDGLKEGDKFIIIESGGRVSSPLNNRYLGRLYLRKGTAVIKTIFEKKSEIELEKTCSPVNIGNFLIPYKYEEQVLRRRINFNMARLPESQVKGRVVYSNELIKYNKENASPGDIVIVDMGKDELSKGDFVLFYKIIKKKLPPVIIGGGIVVKPQNTNSSVKILHSTFPVKVGTYLTLLPETKTGITTDSELPILKDSGELTADVEETEETFDFTVLFDMNETDVSDSFKENFENLEKFAKDKSEYVIILRGYCCSIGGIEYNLELSKKRVEKVKELLINEYKIGESFIETYFYGEKDAPFNNSSEINRQKNRRVDIQVVGK
ncbi:MAG: OmpA family protein [Acidobacteriota bacterium]